MYYTPNFSCRQKKLDLRAFSPIDRAINPVKIKKIFYMPKEIGEKHDQGPLSQTIRDLEKRNHDEFGDRLFSTFQAGRKKTLVFPTPLSRKTTIVGVDEFLVISVDGPKAIQVDKGNTGFANEEAIKI